MEAGLRIGKRSEMEERLYDAAVNDDVPTLHDLLRQDSKLLDKVNVSSNSKTPLHVAAMLGHARFVKAILGYDSSSYMCLARDGQGRNPFHLAAVCGRVDVLEVLISTANVAAAALEKVEGEGNILHLCVKYNQLEALKFLLGKLKDARFVNAVDEEGMTILHRATYHQQKQMVIYLLKEQCSSSPAGGGVVEVNKTNANGESALDLLGKNTEPEIKTYFRRADGLRGPEIVDWDTTAREWYEKSRNPILVVATLIATMTFQIGLNSNWNSNPNPARAIVPVIAQLYPEYYRAIIQANTTSFIASLSIILLIIRGSNVPKKVLAPILVGLMFISVLATAFIYAASLGMLEPLSETETMDSRITGNVRHVLVWILGCSFVTAVYDFWSVYVRGAEMVPMVASSTTLLQMISSRKRRRNSGSNHQPLLI